MSRCMPVQLRGLPDQILVSAVVVRTRQVSLDWQLSVTNRNGDRFKRRARIVPGPLRVWRAAISRPVTMRSCPELCVHPVDSAAFQGREHVNQVVNNNTCMRLPRPLRIEFGCQRVRGRRWCTGASEGCHALFRATPTQAGVNAVCTLTRNRRTRAPVAPRLTPIVITGGRGHSRPFRDASDPAINAIGPTHRRRYLIATRLASDRLKNSSVKLVAEVLNRAMRQ